MDYALVPMTGMSFRTEDEAKEFYRRYAELAGFDISLGNRKTFSRVMRCTRVGKGGFYKGDEDLRVRNNTSKKTRCKAQVKFRRVYDSLGNEEGMVIEWANLFHNHILQPKQTETQHMRGHKSKEPALFEIIDELQAADASSQCIKNVLQNMHGGSENVPITARDRENRKAANMRAEHTDDINKLIEFFKYCEDQNPQFRWNAKLDSEEGHLMDKFDSVLNHPLMSVEFEAAWQEPLDEFDLHNDNTLDSLYRQRELYIPVYFKEQYCGHMASIQRSESSNFMMKKCFVNNKTALHRFAKKTLDFVHTRKMKEAEKTYHGTSKTITRGKWHFEDLSSCSEGEDVNDEDQRNDTSAAEPQDHVVAGGGAVMDVMGPSNEHGRTTNKRKVQLDDSSYGAQGNAIDDSMISQVPPPLAKPKGRKMTASEEKEVTLGAKGKNGECLEAKQNRQRGRPPGAKTKSSAMQHDGVQQEHKTIPATGREVLPKNQYSEWDNDNGSADDMDSEE
ncbi:hypothetical protein C2845_PM10G12010 [Panicum miliaceum]|uniref:Protein FAR1-RELATED SEQUENCE n=1 Tax=Panicum miliaceum TaxID=4540 RepID=A0A3L6PG89_PANMI|nr:hypothetical protein C2845_PM10G12010 [Panicum miliaceum]